MLEKMDAFFNRRIDGYEAHQLHAIEGAQAFYPYTAACLPMQDHAKVLDLGCGTGLELDFYFQRNPTASVTGIDLAAALLRRLQEKFSDKALTAICGSYFDVPFGKERYDAVVSVESLHHFTPAQKRPLYQKIHRALQDTGYFILTDYFAETEAQENFYRREFLRLKAQQGICDDAFYHYDTPLTKAHELAVLQEAGFSSVQILAQWGATATIRAIK